MILSIDTGLANFGLSVFDKQDRIHYTKTIQTKKSKVKGLRVSTDYTNRIRHILVQLKKVILTYEPKIITAEMPSFGSQDSRAAVGMTAGSTILLGSSVFNDIPIVLASPRQIKEYFTKDPNADKKLIMSKCCDIYGWGITYKTVYFKKKDKPDRKDPIYNIMGKKLSAGYFEHIADSIAAYYTCKQLKEFKKIK